MTETTSRILAEAEVLKNDGHPIGYQEPGKLSSWGWRLFLGFIVSLVLALIFFGGWAVFLDEPPWLDRLTDPIANLLGNNESS